MAKGNSKGMSNICKLKYHYVYQTENLINGKTYIGRHSTDKLDDGYIGSGKMLKRAIKKYGKENFICTPMCYFDTYEESVEEEKFLVTKEYCKDINNYNIVEGGSNPIMYGELNAMKGNTHSNETLEKIRNSSKKFFTPVIIDNISYDSLTSCLKPTSNSSIRDVIKKCLSEYYPNYTFLKKEDYHKYLIKYSKNFKIKNRKSVKVFAENTIFKSIYECAAYHNISSSTVDTRCVSNNFKEWYYLDENHQKNREIIYAEKVNKRYEDKRKKTLINKKTVIIIDEKHYYSFKEAGKIYDIYWETVQKRGISSNFPNWIFPEKSDYEKYKNKFEKITEKERNRIRK